ncbi:MAG: GNAT family N-acetyltransferase [Proteobacteria bacterium]|nr:GNAT family N-acetyltransferase [Pseudomonadota bacterium]
MARRDQLGEVLETTVTYLEMTSPPRRPATPAPLGKLAVMRAELPTVSFYRYLYNTVGEAWNWSERRRLDDEAMRAIIRHPEVLIYVLYAAGVPAGFAELDLRRAGEVELAYFGLTPEYVGRGLGAYLLDWAVAAAWTRKPKRVWVHTCTLDHPRALSLYQRAGFVVYKRRVEKVERLVPVALAAPSDGGSG